MSSHAVLADMGGSFAGWAGAFSTWTNGSPTVYALSQGTIYLASTNLISPMVIAPATNGFSSDNGAAIWIP
jgi:hypothetical protein